MIDSGSCSSPRAAALAGAYLANQRQTEMLFVHSLADRMPLVPGSNAGGPRPPSGWLRAGGGSVDSTAADGSVEARSTFGLLQGGADLWHRPMGDGELTAGALASFGHTSTNTEAAHLPWRVDGSSTGGGLGAYATWRQHRASPLGWYADTWGQYDRFSNDVRLPGQASVQNDSHLATMSLETGYGWRLAQSAWTLSPQGQVIYVHNHMTNVTQADGTAVQGEKGTAWIYRLGVNAASDWLPMGGMRWQPSLTLNWWRDAMHDRALLNESVSGHDLYPPERIEVKGAVNVDFRNGWSGGGTLAWATGQQAYRAWTAMANVRFAW